MSFTNTPPPHTPQAPQPEKPLLRQWWFWATIAGTMVVAVILLLAVVALVPRPVARDDGFPDEHSKELAWEAYKCSAAESLDASMIGLQISMDMIQGKIPNSDLAEAKRFSARMGSAKTGEKKVSNYMEYTSTKEASNMCAGWLWEYLKGDSYWEGYKTFTLDKAVEAGLYK